MWSVRALTRRLPACLPALNPLDVLSLVARFEAELPRNRGQVCVRLDRCRLLGWLPGRGPQCCAWRGRAGEQPARPAGHRAGSGAGSPARGAAKDGAGTAQRHKSVRKLISLLTKKFS